MSKKNPIESLLEDARKEYCFSGFQLYAEKGKDKLSLTGGVTSYWPDAEAVREETAFDLGSLTKVILTTSTIARLVDRGELSLSATLGEKLPDLKGTPLEDLTLTHLLTHSAGLIDWYPFFHSLKPWYEVLKANAAAFIKTPPDTAIVYSDVGFLLLGAVLDKNFGPLPELFAREVAGPLGLSAVTWQPVGTAVATEWDLWRGKLVQGEVFDENTAHIGPENCGHAGLFGSARELGKFSRAWLEAVQGKSAWLSEKTAKLFTQKRSGPSGNTWAIGWDTRSRMGSSAGRLFSASAFGHLGFPGTSIWIDPEVGGTCVLLTNRVHPSRADKRIRQLRPRVHDLVFEYWGTLHG